MSKAIRQEAERLAARHYIVQIYRDTSIPGEVVYVAENPELPGCMVQSLTRQEAQEELDEFRVEYIEHLLTNGLRVPAPDTTMTITTTGNPPVRVPKAPNVSKDLLPLRVNIAHPEATADLPKVLTA